MPNIFMLHYQYNIMSKTYVICMYLNNKNFHILFRMFLFSFEKFLFWTHIEWPVLFKTDDK